MDSTRKVARQRALPQTEALPAARRRFDQVCAKGYQGRKRGEVVCTRTVVLQAHTYQFLGTFGGSDNGDYRGELLRALQVLLDSLVLPHPLGQEFGQLLAQWVWNLRLELGQKLSLLELRTTEFAEAMVIELPEILEPTSAVEPVPDEKSTPHVQYGPPEWDR